MMRFASNGYVQAVLGPRDPVLETILRVSLGAADAPSIQVDDNAARLLQLITQLRRPRLALEIGTLFGYSAIHIARGLPEGGHLTSIEINPRMAELARSNIDLAGLSHRVDVVIADAIEYLPQLQNSDYGLIFVDGDKRSYPQYLKFAFPLLEPDGLLITDDVFNDGDYTGESSADPTGQTENRAINTYIQAVGRSAKLWSAFVGTETGLMISRKEQD